jgi:hypothetical protein
MEEMLEQVYPTGRTSPGRLSATLVVVFRPGSDVKSGSAPLSRHSVKMVRSPADCPHCRAPRRRKMPVLADVDDRDRGPHGRKLCLDMPRDPATVSTHRTCGSSIAPPALAVIEGEATCRPTLQALPGTRPRGVRQGPQPVAGQADGEPERAEGHPAAHDGHLTPPGCTPTGGLALTLTWSDDDLSLRPRPTTRRPCCSTTRAANDDGTLCSKTQLPSPESLGGRAMRGR